MFCTFCGKSVPDGQQTCPYCGHQILSATPTDDESTSLLYNNENPNVVPSPPQDYSMPPKNNVMGPPAQYDMAHSSNHSSKKKTIAAVISCIVAIAAVCIAVLIVSGKASDLGFLDYISNNTIKIHSYNNGQDDNTGTSGTGTSGTGTSGTGTSGTGTSGTGTSGTGTSGTGTTGSDDADEKETTSTYEAMSEKVESGDVSSAELTFLSSDVTDYPNVNLYFSLEDSDGDSLTLSSPTAGVVESISGGDEIEREIIKIEQLEGNEGLSIDILADKSSSMSDELSTMQNAMIDFVESLDYATGDQAELITFDSYVMYMCTYTDDVSKLKTGINNMSAYGNTSLYDALYTGVTNASYQAGARCAIAFTDGMDNTSTYTADEVISYALSKEVPIYIIGTYDTDSSVLTNIAEKTGGSFWNIENISSMSSVLDTIYTKQKESYCITYASDPSADAYSERIVSCVIADSSVGAEVTNVSFTPVKPVEKSSGDHHYEIIKSDMSWNEANEAALAKGGHLVTITSQDEMDEVCQLADDSGLHYLWIGGYTSSSDSSGIYGHWVTGEDFSYSKWYPGEPSWYDKDGVAEFYLILWYVDDYWSFNDERDDVVADLPSYSGNMGYIIEYE